MSAFERNCVKLEVCVDSVESAIVAAQGGASRIELCSALCVGGLTPSAGTLKALKSLPLKIPIFCMLRPRCGNFHYSSFELDGLLMDLKILSEVGADGFVFGALTNTNDVDKEMCNRIIREASTLPVTFHRAFDLTDPAKMNQNVNLIKSIGFTRLLSSGFQKTAQEGILCLSELIEKNKNLIIIPGAGINVDNLDELLRITKCREFHASAKAPPNVRHGNFNSSESGNQNLGSHVTTSMTVVQALVSIASTYKLELN